MDLFAAIDVGSNSVRLQIAAFISGFQHQVVKEERTVTRLGESVFETGRLSERAMKETLAVLKAYSARAAEHGVLGLRAVGTSALRDAENGPKFLKQVRRDCGFEVDIISGREEARLIHLGVISRVPEPDEAMLLIDIGGGSAEFTLSDKRRILACSSGPFGSVRLTELFLPSDPPAAEEIERLEDYVRKKLQRVRRTLVTPGMVSDSGMAGRRKSLRAIGTSGTMAAMARAVNRLDSSRAEADGQVFTLSEAEALYRRLRAMDLKARAGVPGINAKRAEIIVAGAAVVMLAMREFEIDQITYSDAGLRDGVLVEMAARRKGDPTGTQYLKAERLEAVRSLGERFGYVQAHSSQVALMARQLFQLLQPVHALPEQYGELLEAAAMLHDIGTYVNVAKSHKHSYYLIANSELPGYTEHEKQLIATIARYHRGSGPSRKHDGFGALSAREQSAVERLAALLRVADACDNGRRRMVHSVVATPRSDRVELTLLASGPAELEAWAVQKTEPMFRRAFGAKLDVSVQVMKPSITA